MNVLYELYGDKVQFLWVYIREAHPSDGNQTQANINEGIILPTPQTSEEREDHANQAAEYLGIEFTAVIDTMDDQVGGLYSALPLRLYLVGTDGNLVYVGGAGPRNYSPPDLETAMARVKHYAAPVNAIRLGLKNPCVEKGICTDCRSPQRICNMWSIIEGHMIEGRIHVKLIGENLGY